MTSQSIDQRFLQPLESMVLALEMKEVPLLIIGEKDQWDFTRQVSAVLGGEVIFSSAQDSAVQILDSLQVFDYLFLILEEPPRGTLGEVIRYYQESRDVLQEIDPALQAKYADHPIHDEHRLILLASRQVVQQLSANFLDLCTKIFVS